MCEVCEIYTVYVCRICVMYMCEDCVQYVFICEEGDGVIVAVDLKLQ